ncbi:unnamed protein product [Haemonchus placei]|uniref:Reverse transcriptase n=1 Tax=Haemonchus placei TaxID=6290 RepID=A0A0N4W3B5_HAEPC|nr:unnamed protein product [Haemonchus placei]
MTRVKSSQIREGGQIGRSNTDVLVLHDVSTLYYDKYRVKSLVRVLTTTGGKFFRCSRLTLSKSAVANFHRRNTEDFSASPLFVDSGAQWRRSDLPPAPSAGAAVFVHTGF